MARKKHTSPTIRDVAKKAGVSLGTASRVLNRQAAVSDAMRVRVEKAIAELGFRPNAIAQGMRRGATKTVGIVVRDITVPVLAEFVKSAHDVFYRADYTLLVASSENEEERELGLINAFTRRRIDGLITTTSSESSPRILKALPALNIPVVLFDRDHPDTFDAVLIDHREGIRRAVDYLVELGHRRIALLTGPDTVRPSRERVRGYKSTMQRHGIAVDSSLICTANFTDQSSYIESCSLLARDRPPTAIIAGGIAMLGGVLRAARGNSVDIPKRLSVIAASDSDLAELATPAVTTVRWNYGEMGRMAAEFLLGRITGQASRTPRRVTFPTDLIVRGSCAAPSDRT